MGFSKLYFLWKGKMSKNFTLLVVAALWLVGAAAFASDWTENVKVKGDFRYRHEMIDTEDKDANHRHRFRIRAAVEGKASPEMKVVFQLASGSDDPVSTNQTLDDAFSSKSVVIDLAYFDYQPVRIRGLSIQGGKFKNPFYKPGGSELLWDSDFNPEGGNAIFVTRYNNLEVKFIGAGLWIDQRSTDKDSWLAAGQTVLSYNLNDKKSAVSLGGAFFNYVNTAGYNLFYDIEDSFGNTTADDSLYAVDYELVEAYVEGQHQINEIPVTVMADYVVNTAADSLKSGWLAGLRLGKAKAVGTWELRYIYRNLEADAVVGVFADSDFRGSGTDARGHEIGGGVQVASKATFNVTYFMNKIDLEGDGSDYSRLQVDLQLKF